MFIAFVVFINSALQRSAMCFGVFSHMPLLTERKSLFTEEL